MRKLPLIFIISIVLTLSACQPVPPVETTTSSTIQETTSTSAYPTTSTTTVGTTTIYPSGGDDTDRFVAAITDNTSIVVDGELKIDKPAVLYRLAEKTITFTSNGALKRTVRPDTVTWQVLVLKETKNITINNLKILGPNIKVCGFLWNPADYGDTTQQPRWINVGYSTKHESQHGLEIRGSENVTVNGAYIYGMSGDGIYLDKSTPFNNKNVKIDKAKTECTGRSSVSNVGSESTTITNSSFHRAGMWIINIEPYNTNRVWDYRISNTKIGYSNLAWLQVAGPYFSCDIRNVQLFVDRSGTGFDLKPSTRTPSINPCVANQILIG